MAHGILEWYGANHTAIGIVMGGLEGPVNPATIRSISLKGYDDLVKHGVFIKGGGAVMSTGFSNVAKHLVKRLKQGYDFGGEDDLINYGYDFFKRTGDDIVEFMSSEGYLHRIDVKTQEYGVMRPDGVIETVMKGEPRPNSNFNNAQEYLTNQLKHGLQNIE